MEKSIFQIRSWANLKIKWSNAAFLNDKTNKQTDESKHKRENKKQSQKPSKKQINETFLKKTHTHAHIH